MHTRLGIMTAAAVLAVAGCGQDDDIELGETTSGSGESSSDESSASEDEEAGPDEEAEPDDGPDEQAGSEGDGPEAGADDDDDEAPTAEDDPEDGAEPVGVFGTDEVASDDFPGGSGDTAFLTDVRVGAHDGFDRIVLELDGEEPPSYRVALVDPPILEDGSGREIDVAGEAFLELRLEPASRVDLAEEEPDVIYEGPDRVDGDVAATVTEVVLAGDFEANLAWVAGLTSEQPFAVTMLEDPLRLVVDVESD